MRRAPRFHKRNCLGLAAILVAAGAHLFAAPAPSSPVARRNEVATGLAVEERGDVLAGPGAVTRTLLLPPARGRAGALDITWEVRFEAAPAGGAGAVAATGSAPPVAGPGVRTAGGSLSLAVRPGAPGRVPISFNLPAVERPRGMILRVTARGAERPPLLCDLPFTVYPAAEAARLKDRFDRARVALFDPGGTAGAALRSLGLSFEEFRSFEGLAVYKGDLIVVGPGGFGRGAENLGPILGARARAGTRILILHQPDLPATLSEDLRLWPAFSRALETRPLLDPDHPILAGLTSGEAGAFFATGPSVRRLVPPSRGNFRVLAGVRTRSGVAWREGVALLELPVGTATAILAQAPLAEAYERDARARILLANTVAYLLGDHPAATRARLYGRGDDDLPACLGRLKPILPVAPADLAGVDLLVVPGGWHAYRLRSVGTLPPLAACARYLRDGGSVLLLDPQPMVLDFLEGILGASVSFTRDAPGPPGLPAAQVLRGVASDDLALLVRSGAEQFRMRAAAGSAPVEPLLVGPGLSLYRVGSGSLAVLSVPEGDACASSAATSLIARLLTNLGVPLDHAPGAGTVDVSLLAGEDPDR